MAGVYQCPGCGEVIPDREIHECPYADQPVRRRETISIPVTLAARAALTANFPMTEDEWTRMLLLLDAMKPGLVTP